MSLAVFVIKDRVTPIPRMIFGFAIVVALTIEETAALKYTLGDLVAEGGDSTKCQEMRWK